MYKLYNEQDSKAQRTALTAAIDNTNTIYTYTVTSAHVTYTDPKKINYKIKSHHLSSENEDYAYFRKLVKSTSVDLKSTVFKTTKGTEVYTCWQGIPNTNN